MGAKLVADSSAAADAGHSAAGCDCVRDWDGGRGADGEADELSSKNNKIKPRLSVRLWGVGGADGGTRIEQGGPTPQNFLLMARDGPERRVTPGDTRRVMLKYVLATGTRPLPIAYSQKPGQMRSIASGNVP